MNRKGRAALKHHKRVAASAPASFPSRDIGELATQARRHFDLRDFETAQKLCKEVLSHAPSHVDSMNLLGLMAQESARHAKAVRVFNKAIAAGAKVVKPVQDQFYGDRSGFIEDPFGHRWGISTHKEDVSEEEMKKRMAAMFSQK